MSLFLGKVHYWLYNKILWAEVAEEEIILWAKRQGLPVEALLKQNIDRYGAPTGNKPLEEIIDTSGIHGWLQKQIESTELRQAALVTAILKENPDALESLVEIFKRQGEASALQCDTANDSPEGIFNAIHDFILEGMPCDRVNKVISNNDDEFIWQTTTCLHTPYWHQVQGDVQHFYLLREAWIKAFVEKLNPAFKVVKTAEGNYRIVRERKENKL